MDGDTPVHGDKKSTNPELEAKPPIYPSPTPETLLVDVVSPLEHRLRSGRRKVTEVYREAHSQVQDVVSRWIGVEHAIENRVKSILSPNEPLTPGLLYVGVATLTGSIISRNRRLPIRLLLPPTLFALSLNHFLPKTTSNLKFYLAHLEEKHFPNLAEKHGTANAHSSMAWHMLKQKLEEGREKTENGARGVVDKVQEVTGLKVKELFRLEDGGRKVMERVEEKAMDAVKVVEEKAGVVKAVLDKKLEEVKDTAQKKAKDYTSGSEEKRDV